MRRCLEAFVHFDLHIQLLFRSRGPKRPLLWYLSLPQVFHKEGKSLLPLKSGTDSWNSIEQKLTHCFSVISVSRWIAPHILPHSSHFNSVFANQFTCLGRCFQRGWAGERVCWNPQWGHFQEWAPLHLHAWLRWSSRWWAPALCDSPGHPVPANICVLTDQRQGSHVQLLITLNNVYFSVMLSSQLE